MPDLQLYLQRDPGLLATISAAYRTSFARSRYPFYLCTSYPLSGAMDQPPHADSIEYDVHVPQPNNKPAPFTPTNTPPLNPALPIPQHPLHIPSGGPSHVSPSHAISAPSHVAQSDVSPAPRICHHACSPCPSVGSITDDGAATTRVGSLLEHYAEGEIPCLDST